MHNGVRETLTEVIWIIRGRSFIRKVLHSCVTCRRYEGKSYPSPKPPPLPEFRIREAPPFLYTGVDLAGPVHVRCLSNEVKIWICCLFTCCVIRAIHLEIVPDMTAQSFIRCFKRFTSRRGIPQVMVSDNGKTFCSWIKDNNKNNRASCS